MKLKYNQRIFESASKEPGRYSMHGVLFEPKGDVVLATATDGRQLARIEVELEPGETLDAPVLLDAKAMKQGWGRGKGDRRIFHNGCDWKLEVGAQVSTISVVDGEFPRVNDVIPEQSSDRLMTFNVSYLAAMAKAAGADTVTIEVPTCTKGQVREAMRVRFSLATESIDGVGVLMPITVD